MGFHLKKLYAITVLLMLCVCFSACANEEITVDVAATTAPVYEFTNRICSGTDIRVGQVITQEVSCLHDYTLQTDQMRMIENAEIIIISGAGLDEFVADGLLSSKPIINTSENIDLLFGESDHEHSHSTQEHHNTYDPHIWLSPVNAMVMAQNICQGLCVAFPQYETQFQSNLQSLSTQLQTLTDYGKQQLQTLGSKDLITFHDGFAYFAHTYGLNILYAIEEESGSEPSAAELKEICNVISEQDIRAIFTERNSSASAANIIGTETNTLIYQLDMAMSGDGYLEAMYHNIDTIKEALG